MGKRMRRLYDQFHPSTYDLELSVDDKTMLFSGSVLITGQKVGRPSQRLTFHQKNLNFEHVTISRLVKGKTEKIKIVRINKHNKFDEVRLHTEQMLYPGQYSVSIKFDGKISRQMNGIYPSYFEQKKVQKTILATQFESHHAREAFPCIDEPEAKATFDFRITTPESKTIIANTPFQSQRTDKTCIVTTFETTPKMSTYLLAFVYGDIDFIEAKTSSGIVVRSYATAANVKHTSFALECAVKMLEFYNDYFGIDYPLAKCDLVALPDFASGAMENWGCITFREQALLVDPKNTSLITKQYVALVVAHELAHQWFGNLVTMRWWTDLWLNEGFASWIEYLAVDKLFPEWDVWTQFISDEQEQGLRPDSLRNTHAVEVPINHPDEIRTIFDSISYQKGSCVINMLHKYLGADTFRNGLRSYLKTHEYGNTDTVDLWSALEKDSRKPVKRFMHAWTSQAGFPIIHAKINDNNIELEQQRFFLDPMIKQDATTWPIDLEPSEALGIEIFDQKKMTIKLPKKVSAPIFNHSRFGYYRVAYDSTYLEILTADILSGKVSPLDRLGILSDSSEAAKAGHLKTVGVLKLLQAYEHEDSTVVWDIIASLIGNIKSVMDEEALREAMKPFVAELVSKQLARLGWEIQKDESYFDSLLRPTILGMAASADEPGVLKTARDLFNTATKPEDIHPDVRGIVFGTIARTGYGTDFDKLLEMYKKTKNSEDKIVLAGALTGFKHKEQIQAALDTITTDTVKLQDVGYWVGYSFMNHHAKKQTWDWMVEHWDWLQTNLGSDLSFYRFPNYAARGFSNESFLPIYKEFFNAHMSQAFERSVAQGVETIEWHVAWQKRDIESIKKFFKM
jgi:puromycin-sensitive aminopeptidase